MDINQLENILDQITFSISEVKKQTTQMHSVAKFLATQLQILETNKDNFTMTVNESFEKMKLDILILQNKINDRLVFADECHIKKLDEITNAANETQKIIINFAEILEEKITQNIIQKVIFTIDTKFEDQEKKLFELTTTATKNINSIIIQINNYTTENKLIQEALEKNANIVLDVVNKKIQDTQQEMTLLATNINLINQSTIETLQTINQIENLKLWGGKLSIWLVISANSFLFGVIFTAIAAAWYNPALKAFIAAFLQK